MIWPPIAYVEAVVPRLVAVGATGALLWCFADVITDLWERPPYRDHPDAQRQAAEYTMGARALGAALENVLLGAHAYGLAGFWMCAPVFSPLVARAALRLDPSWEPQALILLGYPREAPPTREAHSFESLRVFR